MIRRSPWPPIDQHLVIFITILFLALVVKAARADVASRYNYLFSDLRITLRVLNRRHAVLVDMPTFL